MRMRVCMTLDPVELDTLYCVWHGHSKDCVCVCSCVHVYLCVHAGVYVCMCVCMYFCAHTVVCVCVHVTCTGFGGMSDTHTNTFLAL